MSLGTPAIHTQGKALCGVCGNKMAKLPFPPETWVAFRDGSTTPTLLGKEGHIRPGALEKVKRMGVDLVKIVPVQYGCLDDGTIHTFWFRKDGQEGDLWRVMQIRKGGEGPEVVSEMPGTLEEIDGSL